MLLKKEKKSYDPPSGKSLFTLGPANQQVSISTGFENDERLQPILPFGKRPGRMYVARDDDTPKSIAKILGINVSKLVKMNLKDYPGLQSKLPPSPTFNSITGNRGN